MELEIIEAFSAYSLQLEVNKFAETHQVKWELCTFEVNVVTDEMEVSSRYTAFIVYAKAVKIS